MKKVLFLITGMVLFLYACGNNEQNGNTAENGTTEETNLNSEYKDTTFALNYNFTKGMNLKYKLSSTATTNQTIVSDSTIKNDIKQSITYYFNMDVLEVNQDGYKFSIGVDSVNMKASFKDENLTYNSEEESDLATKRKFAEYASLSDAPYTVTVSKQGRITEVNNIDKVISNYLDIQGAPAIPPEKKSELIQQMKDGAIQPLTQQLFKYLPEEKVGLDSTWSLTYDSKMGVFTLSNTANSFLTSIIKNDNNEPVAKIDVGLNVKIEGEGNVTRNGVDYNFQQPKVIGDGTIYFNLDTGLVTKSETTTKVEMSLDISGNDPQKGPMTASRKDISENSNYLELISVN